VLTASAQTLTLRVNNTLNKRKPLRHNILTIIHNENTTDIKLDMIVLLLIPSLKHIKGGTLGAEQNSLEFELSLDGKVLDGGVLLPVVGDGLVKGCIFVLGDIVGFAHPEGLHVVEVLPFVGYFLDLFGLCIANETKCVRELLSTCKIYESRCNWHTRVISHLLLFLGIILINLLNLGLVIISLILIVVIIIRHLLLGSLLRIELNRKTNKLRMLLHQILNPPLLQVFRHVLLQMENDTGTTSQSRIVGLGNGERASSLRGPRVGFVLVVLRHDLHLVGDEVGRVEPHAELTNHGDVSAGGKCLHEGLGPRLGDGSEVIHEIGLGHTDTAILDGEGVVGLVGDELDLELGLAVEDGGVGEGLVADFIEGIGGVGDEFAKEDFLVGVEGVDDEGEELVDVGREGVRFRFGHDCFLCWGTKWWCCCFSKVISGIMSL
jgi:hypothetical protein